MADFAESATFYYMDDDGKLQGPFTAMQLHAWVPLLGTDRLVARAPHGMPRPCGDWVAEWELAASHATTLVASQATTTSSRPLERLPPSAPPEWYYIDDDEDVQGPFDAAQLAEWADALGGARRVGRSASGPFAPLDSCRELDALADADSDPAERAASDADHAAPVVEQPPIASPATPTVAPAPSPAAGPTGAWIGREASQASEGEQPLFEYVDDAGAVQGPFSAAHIGAWLRAQLLQPARLARPASSAEVFRPMAAIGALAPFCAGSAPPPHAPAACPASAYLYIDTSGTEQGPFARDLMRAWACAGALPPSTLVRTPSQPSHAPLSAWPELSAPMPVAHAPLSAAQLRLEAALGPVPNGGAAWQAAAAQPRPRDRDAGAEPATSADSYVARGTFNARTGRFVAVEGADAYAHRAGQSAAGFPGDRAPDRQLAHYFDIEHERNKRRRAA